MATTFTSATPAIWPTIFLLKVPAAPKPSPTPSVAGVGCEKKPPSPPAATPGGPPAPATATPTSTPISAPAPYNEISTYDPLGNLTSKAGVAYSYGAQSASLSLIHISEPTRPY